MNKILHFLKSEFSNHFFLSLVKRKKNEIYSIKNKKQFEKKVGKYANSFLSYDLVVSNFPSVFFVLVSPLSSIFFAESPVDFSRSSSHGNKRKETNYSLNHCTTITKYFVVKINRLKTVNSPPFLSLFAPLISAIFSSKFVTQRSS